MNTLLIFFALPIATIILAIVLQKVLKCPILIALTFFAIYLIVTFAAFDANFLIFAIVYTILAYIAAVITRFIMNAINDNDDNNCGCSNTVANQATSNNSNVQNLVNAINTLNTVNGTNSNNCGCGCRGRRR